MQPYRSSQILVFSIITLITQLFAHATVETVSRKAPDIYESKIQPLLTSYEAAIKLENIYTQDESGVIILNEKVHYITEDGLRISAYHAIYKVNEQSGVNALTEEVFSYRKSNQRIHLIEARTIQPDGSIQQVRENAAILRSPQNRAEDAIYSDEGELLVILPNIKVGSITELIVITEETAPRVENELMLAFNWSTRWPRLLKRRVIDAPKNYIDRLQITNIGTSYPPAIPSDSTNERTRLTWEKLNSDREKYEYDKAPAAQIGPYTRVTTWNHWDDLALWYSPLINSAPPLSEALLEAVHVATKDLKSEMEIIDALHRMVANEVRYTGLEFGISSYQPYPPNEVWDRGYGDCKDKANLLRLCLAAKGIESYLCLLNTEHLGRIEKRSPDTTQFDHAILAVKDPENPEAWIFCDPTISKSGPGLISPNDSDRDVLLIDGDQSIWAHTPPMEAGALNYTFDLEIAPSGECSVWFEFTAKDYYACSYLQYYENIDSHTRRRYLKDIIDDFYPDVEVIDTSLPVMSEETHLFKVRAYCLLPSIQEKSPMGLPSLRSITLYLGDQAERLTPKDVWRDQITFNFNVQLPEGLEASNLPSPYTVQSPGFAAKGAWQREANQYSASIVLDCPKSSLESDDFAASFNAIKSFNTWSQLNVQVTQANAQILSPKSGNEASSSIEMPIMPTANGQLTFINKRFPTTGNLDQRREALTRMVSYFPEDKNIAFRSKVDLAYIDYLEDQNAQAAASILEVIGHLGDAAEDENMGWAEYVRAISLYGAGQSNEAAQLHQRIFENTAYSDYRRAWAAYKAAEILFESSPDEAIAIIRKSKSLNANTQPYLYTLLTKLLLNADNSEALNIELEALVQNHSPYLSEITRALIREAQSQVDSGQIELSRSILNALTKAEMISSRHVTSDIEAELATLKQSIESHDRSIKLQTSIQELINQSPPHYWAELSLDTQLDSRESYIGALEKFKDEENNAAFLRHCIELLVRFSPDDDFYYYMWRAAAYIEWQERSIRAKDGKVGLFSKFMRICDEIPITNDNYYECQFVKGTYYRLREEYPKEIEAYEGMLANEAFPESFDASIYARYALALEKIGKFEQALDQYRLLEDNGSESSDSIDALTRAVYINLHLGNRKDAIRIIERLETYSESNRENAETSLQLSELLLIKNHTIGLMAFWEAQEKWQPAWRELLHTLTGEFTPNLEIPVFEGYDFIDEMFTAVNQKDKETFLYHFKRLAGAAHYESNAINELARLSLYGAAPLYPEHANSIRSFIDELYTFYVPSDDQNALYSSLYHSIALIDNKQPSRALEVINDFQTNFPSMDTAVAQSMLYLRSMAETELNKDSSQTMQMFEALLKSDVFTHSRYRDVIQLANLYRKAGESEKEEALLAREVDHPQIVENTEQQQQIESRFQLLAQNGQTSKSFSSNVAVWLKTHQPAWFEFANPQTINHLSTERILRLLENPNARYNTAETIKFQLLAARDSDLSSDQKWEAFSSAVQSLAHIRQDLVEVNRFYNSIHSDTRFSDTQRAYYAWMHLVMATSYEDSETAKTLFNHPTYDMENIEIRDGLPVFKAFFESDLTHADSLYQLAQNISDKEFTYIHIFVLKRTYELLLQRGHFDLAESILKQSTEWEISPRIQTTRSSIRLELLQMLKACKEYAELNRTLGNRILSDIPKEYTRPEILNRVSPDELPTWLGSHDHVAIAYYQISQGTYHHWNPSKWMDVFVHLSASGTKEPTMMLELIKDWLESVTDDFERSSLYIYIPMMFDLDATSTRSKVFSLLQEYNTPQTHPLTADAITYLKTRMRLRIGEDVNVPASLSHIKHPYLKQSIPSIELEYYLLKEHLASLRAVIRSMEPAQLEATGTLPNVLKAMSVLEMTDELEILSDQAQITQRSLITSSWATTSTDEAIQALLIASTLKQSAELPDQWLEDLIYDSRDALNLGILQCFYQQINQDWEQLAKTSSTLKGRYPSYYIFYWFNGHALYKLNRYQEAIEPLKVYVEYSKDELKFKEAEHLLKQIQMKLNPTESQ